MDVLYTEAKKEFKELLSKCGYAESIIDAAWSWYDFSEKKGVASF
ncbi:MAG: hypothetical protein NWF04_03525 [Candidatus Bathyarchaeota archaeon]|nr:hypothetical protein [Candidatus Bathyarchaeota archaeon]